MIAKRHRPPGSRRLTHQQLEFVLALNSFSRNPSLCPTKAARLAGYSEKHAKAAAYRLLHAPQYQHVRFIGRRYVELLFERVPFSRMMGEIQHSMRLRQADGLRPYMPECMVSTANHCCLELERLEAESRHLLDTERHRVYPWL